MPLPGTLARIVDPEFPEVELPAGQCGELQVNGPQVPAGVWDRWSGRVHEFESGWRSAGEWARRDTDGFFYIVDEGQFRPGGREEARRLAPEEGEAK